MCSRWVQWWAIHGLRWLRAHSIWLALKALLRGRPASGRAAKCSAEQPRDDGCSRVQVYKNNGLPVGAAVGLPLAAVALAAGLLYMAHLKGKRTARCPAFPFSQSGPAPDTGWLTTPERRVR